MNQTFNTVFDLNEATVVRNVRDLAEHTRMRRVATCEILPRIITELLHAKRNTLALAIELEDLDVDFLTNVHNLGRMLDALPGHIGDVQQTVDATEIDERAVIGEVLDDALDRVAFLQLFQQLLTLSGVLLLNNSTT